MDAALCTIRSRAAIPDSLAEAIVGGGARFSVEVALVRVEAGGEGDEGGPGDEAVEAVRSIEVDGSTARVDEGFFRLSFGLGFAVAGEYDLDVTFSVRGAETGDGGSDGGREGLRSSISGFPRQRVAVSEPSAWVRRLTSTEGSGWKGFCSYARLGTPVDAGRVLAFAAERGFEPVGDANGGGGGGLIDAVLDFLEVTEEVGWFGLVVVGCCCRLLLWVGCCRLLLWVGCCGLLLSVAVVG